MRRLEELLRQMVQAAKSIGNSELENKFSEGIKLIKRDIIFAASLYLWNESKRRLITGLINNKQNFPTPIFYFIILYELYFKFLANHRLRLIDDTILDRLKTNDSLRTCITTCILGADSLNAVARISRTEHNIQKKLLEHGKESDTYNVRLWRTCTLRMS